MKIKILVQDYRCDYLGHLSKLIRFAAYHSTLDGVEDEGAGRLSRASCATCWRRDLCDVGCAMFFTLQNAHFVKQNIMLKTFAHKTAFVIYFFYFRLTIWTEDSQCGRRCLGERMNERMNVFPAGFVATGFSVLRCRNICKRRSTAVPTMLGDEANAFACRDGKRKIQWVERLEMKTSDNNRLQMYYSRWRNGAVEGKMLCVVVRLYWN